MTDGFVITDRKSAPTSDEAALKIDEGAQKITVQIPTDLPLVTKKIIERRVQSIAKSGFLIPDSGLRIGGGFTVEMSKTNDIPDVLLQEGHKYTFGEFAPPSKQVTKETEIVKSLPQQEEYVPSFLQYDPDQSLDSTSIKQQIQERAEPDIAGDTDATSEEILETSPRDDYDINKSTIAGNFIVALSEYGEIFLERKGEDFIVEYPMGKINFNVKDNEINILSTERISQGDQTLQTAIEKSRKSSN